MRRLRTQHSAAVACEWRAGAHAADMASLPTLSEIEEKYILEVLESCEGNKSQAARVLGVSRQGLIERIKRMERRSPQLS